MHNEINHFQVEICVKYSWLPSSNCKHRTKFIDIKAQVATQSYARGIVNELCVFQTQTVKGR